MVPCESVGVVESESNELMEDMEDEINGWWLLCVGHWVRIRCSVN